MEFAFIISLTFFSSLPFPIWISKVIILISICTHLLSRAASQRRTSGWGFCSARSRETPSFREKLCLRSKTERCRLPKQQIFPPLSALHKMLIHLLFSINSTIHCFPNHSVPLLITSRWFFFAKSDIGFRNLSRDNLIFSPHCCFFGCQIFVWEPVRFFLLLVKIRFSLGKPASQSTVPAPPRPAVHCRPPGCQAGPQRRRRRRRGGGGEESS